jgi:arylsulfatase A-like enzyme
MSTERRPNILFVMADDHGAQAMSCYNSRINTTPNLDRIAQEGMRLDRCFCANSICAPSRATILTGLHSHLNGVLTLGDRIDNSQSNVAKHLQGAGYQTAIVGKWHLGTGPEHCPTGFDYWCVLPGQGLYHDPEMIEMGESKIFPGYVTDIITDKAIDWLEERDPGTPFFLCYHHKAPHRRWFPDEKHAQMYEDETIPEPPTFNDDYQNRASAAEAAKMRVGRDLTDADTKGPPPEGLSGQAVKEWKYQRFIKDYLRCVASIDDNMGRMFDYLDEQGLTDDTVIIYTSDQGFFLGEHGWYDKRFMYEESLKMPFIVRYPREIPAGSTCDDIVSNVDFAPTFLDYAGVDIPEEMQGRSIRPLLCGETPDDWPTSLYYRYWMHLAHHYVYAHYGVRTERYKLIYYYAKALGTTGSIEDPKPPEWELFDLEVDPLEMNSVYDDPDYADTVATLKKELARLRDEVQDHSEPWVDKSPASPIKEK